MQVTCELFIMAKEVVKALEAGKRIEDHRGVVYRQEFGEAFLNTMKREIESSKAMNDKGS